MGRASDRLPGAPAEVSKVKRTLLPRSGGSTCSAALCASRVRSLPDQLMWSADCCSTGPPSVVILMTMSEFATLADAKAHLSEFVSRVGSQHDRVTVTVHGRPTAVLLAVEDLDALEETIAVLSDTAALRALAEADSELARGEGETEAALRDAMRARRASA